MDMKVAVTATPGTLKDNFPKSIPTWLDFLLKNSAGYN